MFIAEYFIWYYTYGIRGLARAVRNYMKFFWHFFSVGILLSTLFFPWKKDITVSNWRGLHPILYLNKTIYNLFAIFIGAIIRTPVAVTGLMAEVLTMILGVVSFVFWIFYPIFFLASLFFITKKTDASFYIWAQISASVLLLICIAIFSASFSLFLKSRKKRPEMMSLEELSKETWFSRAWNRLGFIKEDSEIKKAFSDRKLLEKIMNRLGLRVKDLEGIIDWEIKRKKRTEIAKRFWSEENLMAIEPIGKYWHFAYTVELDRYSYSLPRRVNPYSQSYLMGRAKDIEMAEVVLSRPSQNNIIFVGEPGVGKKTLVNLIAKKIKEEKTNPALKYKRFAELELDRVVSDFKGNDLINELHRIFQEAAFAGNVILVINNIHEFLSREGEMGVDITSTLVQYLAIPTFQIIGITDSHNFHTRIEKNASIMKYLDKIIINELSLDEARSAMLNFLEKEEKRRILVSQQAIEEILKLSDQYITESPMPEKAIDILEEVLIYWSQNSSNYFVTKEDVDKVFSQKIKIPLGEIGQAEQLKLIKLEEILRKRVIGQEEVIKQISQAMLRARSGISDRSKPIGSFLFLGSTGVGKTETAKALAEAYFGSEERMIRLDMSEFQAADSIARILGDEKTGEPSRFLSEVSENPFSVLLLDEIEKAYPEILNLFLQVLDEGWITDVFGKKIIFKNMIIIATSNAGSEIIKDGIEGGYTNEVIHKQVIDYSISSGIFRPEFLNRFENVLFFRSLEGKELEEVATLILNNMFDRVYKNKNIKINFGNELTKKIIEKGYDPIFGARSIKHFVQDKVEDVLAKKIVEGKVKEGEDMELGPESIS